MKRISLIFGGVTGLILTTNSIIHINMMYVNPDYKGNDVVGYASMVIIFSLIYFGVRNYRNNHLNGTIGFSSAFKTGALICFIASTFYVVFGVLHYYMIRPDFLDVYSDWVIRNSAPDEVAMKTAQMESFREMSKNPLFVILISYVEVLPIGMVVALFSALMVKKK